MPGMTNKVALITGASSGIGRATAELFVAHPQTPKHQQLMAEWQRRTETGEGRLELIGPDIWAPLPGLFTCLILTTEGGPIYLTGLGDTLVKLEIQD